MKIALKLLPLLAFAAAGAYTMAQFKKVSSLAAAVKPGQAPSAESLRQLAEADKTGVVGKLLEAQQAQLGRLTDLPGEEPAAGAGAQAFAVAASPAPGAAAAPAEAARPRGPVAIYDTNSGPGVKVTRGPSARPAAGRAVMIDQATGERYELSSARRPEPKAEPAPPAASAKAALQAGLKKLEAPSLVPETGDLETRKRRAYAWLIGTAVGAFVLAFYLRRAFHD